MKIDIITPSQVKGIIKEETQSIRAQISLLRRIIRGLKIKIIDLERMRKGVK